MGSERKIKENRGEALFFAAFIPLLFVLFLDTTSFPFIVSDAFLLLKFVVSLFSVLLVIAKVLLYDEFPNQMVKLALLLLLALLACQAAVLLSTWELAVTVALCIGAYKVDLRKALWVYLLVSLPLVLITTLLALFGVIPNYSIEKNGILRYGLGNFYCTDYAARIFFLMLVFLLLFHKKLKFRHLLALAALSVAVFIPTFAKLDFACMLLLLIVFAIDLSARKAPAFARFWRAAWEKAGLLSMPVAAVFMTILTWVYTPDNKALEAINQALTQRLTFGKQGFSRFGITWLGQYVVYQGGYETVLENYNFVDCSYLHMLFREGVLATLLVIALYVLIARKFRGNLVVMYTVTLIAINCMFAHHLIEFMYNPFLILLLADTTTLFGARTCDGVEDRAIPVS